MGFKNRTLLCNMHISFAPFVDQNGSGDRTVLRPLRTAGSARSFAAEVAANGACSLLGDLPRTVVDRVRVLGQQPAMVGLLDHERGQCAGNQVQRQLAQPGGGFPD